MTDWYDALVVDVADPTGQGRVRLQIPQVSGAVVTGWALPMQTGTVRAGDQVYATFHGGDADRPLFVPPRPAVSSLAQPGVPGVVGDGVADDTAAIQAALDSVPSTGGSVFLPAGRYLLNSAAGLHLTTPGTVLIGEGAENTKILIGAGFGGGAAVSVTAYNCQIRDLSVSGSSSTTASNPACCAVQVSGARRTKVDRVTFFYVNGWCVEALSTSASGSSNVLGTQLSKIFGSNCAGGIHFRGHTAQGYAVNSQITDVQFYQGGVTTGSSANLDTIRIEDAWDVLSENVIAWTSNGTGSSFHVVGNSAASFTTNLDALGPSTGPCVLINDGSNGSPQNTQIIAGVIQQGSVGVQISGGSKQVHISTSRIINNQTHGIQVDGTATTIYLSELFFSLSGMAATGTNYDINWSGTAVGFVTNCRFATPVVSTGTAGVQQTVNVAAGQNVRFINASFQGTGATSANWFTNTPSAVLEASSGALNFVTRPSFKNSLASQPPTSSSTAFSVNVNGADTFDRYRMLGDGSFSIGPGTTARDTTWQRTGAAQIGTNDSDIVIGLAGKGLKVKEGTNAKMGTATLAAGTVAVSTTAVTANSRIFLTNQSGGGTPGAVRVSARTAGTSFTITSTSSSDTSTVAWLLVEPS